MVGVDREGVRTAQAGDEVPVGAGAVEVGAADPPAEVVDPVELAVLDGDVERVADAGDEVRFHAAAVEVGPAIVPA